MRRRYASTAWRPYCTQITSSITEEGGGIAMRGIPRHNVGEDGAAGGCFAAAHRPASEARASLADVVVLTMGTGHRF